MSLQFYSEKEDNLKEESIDKYQSCFIEYLNKLPTLKEALEQLFISEGATQAELNELVDDILLKCKEVTNRNFEKIQQKFKNISREEAEIIASYTCESKDKKYNPYKILNTNLTSDDREKGIRNISQYFYILIKALRKLPKYYPDKNKPYLYRCIRRKVCINYDQFDKTLVPYIVGNTKTFWAFTSSSPNLIVNFLGDDKNKNIKCGTIFTLVGDVWGYDISLFNYYKEEEILLEPERKFKIEQVIPPVNEIINIRCSLIETPLVVEKFDNIEIFKKILLDEILLSSELLDSKGDKSSEWSVNSTRGGEKYIPPLSGWVGIGLKVLDKYENNDWISNKNIKGEYSVAYYGINHYLNDFNSEKKEINNFVKDITKIKSENIFINENDKRSGIMGTLKKKCGEGICLFQNPEYAENSAGKIKINGLLYKILLMCRVNPSKIRQPSLYDNFWILNPIPNEVRPYRILIKKIENIPLPRDIKIINENPVNFVMDAINSNDFSFYKLKDEPIFFHISSINGLKISDEYFAIRLYESDYYKYLYSYINDQQIIKNNKGFRGFSQKELNSWICCLQNAIKNNKNVANGTKVYRGFNKKFPNNINIGSKFYFSQFVSTTKKYQTAIHFASRNGTIISIDIQNNGTDENHPNYCYYIKHISFYQDEEEVLFASHCYFQVTNIKRCEEMDQIDLICLGYLLNK